MRPGTPLSRPEPEIECPVPLERLGEIYRADADDLPHLLAALTPGTRARLAAYCYGKSHTHQLGLTIARACEREDLVRAAGELGAVIHGQAHLKPGAPAPAAGASAGKPAAAPARKISLGGSAAKGRSFD